MVLATSASAFLLVDFGYYAVWFCGWCEFVVGVSLWLEICVSVLALLVLCLFCSFLVSACFRFRLFPGSEFAFCVLVAWLFCGCFVV